MITQEPQKKISDEKGLTARLKRRKSSFAGDVLKLVTGTTFAQLLAILAAPVLTRLYAPDAFGILALFTSITGILGVIACLRYELSIMLPEKDEEAANLLGASMAFVILVSLLTVPLIWWGKDSVIRWLNAPDLAPFLWLVPVMVFIHGVFLALNYWNSRTKHFGRLSIARVTSSLTTVMGKLGVGFMGYATAGTMIGATVAGQAVATSVLGGQIWRDDRKMFFKSIRWKEMRKGIVRHKKFPLLSSWSSLMNTISVQLPPLLLAFFFSSTIVGFYALGHRLLSMTMSLIGSSIAQVFFSERQKQRSGALHSSSETPLYARCFRCIATASDHDLRERLFFRHFPKSMGRSGHLCPDSRPMDIIRFFRLSPFHSFQYHGNARNRIVFQLYPLGDKGCISYRRWFYR